MLMVMILTSDRPTTLLAKRSAHRNVQDERASTSVVDLVDRYILLAPAPCGRGLHGSQPYSTRLLVNYSHTQRCQVREIGYGKSEWRISGGIADHVADSANQLFSRGRDPVTTGGGGNGPVIGGSAGAVVAIGIVALVIICKRRTSKVRVEAKA